MSEERFQQSVFWMQAKCPSCGHIHDAVYTPDLLYKPMDFECDRHIRNPGHWKDSPCKAKWSIALDEGQKGKIGCWLVIARRRKEILAELWALDDALKDNPPRSA